MKYCREKKGGTNIFWLSSSAYLLGSARFPCVSYFLDPLSYHQFVRTSFLILYFLDPLNYFLPLILIHSVHFLNPLV